MNIDSKECAIKVLLQYIQSQGQDNKKRLLAFAAVAYEMGFSISVAEKEGEYVFELPKSQVFVFDEFRQRVRNILRGHFESEAAQIENLIEKYAGETVRWWQFWKKWRQQ